MKRLLAIAISLSFAFGGLPAQAQVPGEFGSASSVLFVHESNAGQFCKAADVGEKKIASNGKRIKCKKVNGRARWVNY